MNIDKLSSDKINWEELFKLDKDPHNHLFLKAVCDANIDLTLHYWENKNSLLPSFHLINHKTLLQHAVANQYKNPHRFEIISLLWHHLINEQSANENKEFILFYATESNHILTVQYILNQFKSFYSPDFLGSLLFKAVECDYTNLATYLIQENINPYWKNNNGLDSIQYAEINDNLELLQQLLHKAYHDYPKNLFDEAINKLNQYSEEYNLIWINQWIEQVLLKEELTKTLSIETNPLIDSHKI